MNSGLSNYFGIYYDRKKRMKINNSETATASSNAMFSAAKLVSQQGGVYKFHTVRGTVRFVYITNYIRLS